MKNQLRHFFENLVELSRGAEAPKRFLSAQVSDKFNLWANQVEENFRSDAFLDEMTRALDEMRVVSEGLCDAFDKELAAVSALQDAALNHSEEPVQSADIGGEPDERKREKNWRVVSRAGEASHSLLSSLREALAEALPGWAKGILKMGEELWEIYGRRR